jgi:hypothetical protein
MAKVLSMRMNMNNDRAKFGSYREEFLSKCNKFLAKIYPSLEFGSDAQVKADKEMLELYLELKNTYGAACYSSQQAKHNQGMRKASAA